MDKKGITQAELSKGTGIHAGSISDWKRKGTNPSADKIYVICRFLNITTDYLLAGDESSTAPDLSHHTIDLITRYNSLPEDGKTLVRAALINAEDRYKERE